ncbi:sugar-transfer associated ATP-grasp domain-containing protein [Sphingosinicella sp.]|uniref:sugar-transfer associated ATP-grasp domain-containing protein n=1 Tax=Sphingosinicella sp. TaxID=1917971 RepID=UPI001840A7DA|nr:sugar-transfer associated ATP-grasp domain-containing protein [Sphingosinicella sp.]MBA4759867.1 hypothetical protein [Sphingosinicella sp.]
MKARGPWHDYPRALRELLRREPQSLPMVAAKLGWCRARHGLGPRDFFDFELRHRPTSTWRDYLSDVPHMRRIMRALHPEHLARLANDKVLSTERLMERGVPVAPVYVVAGRDTQSHPAGGRLSVVNDAATLRRWLEGAPDRLFCKPATGSFGNGVFRAHRDGAHWRVGGISMSAAAFAEHLLGQDDRSGTLVSPELRNHPALAPIAADLGLSATRVYTAYTTTGIEIFCTIQKVMTTPALADNFHDGSTGHLLCFVDPENGCITRAYGRDPDDQIRLSTYETHALTGAHFTGFPIPFWNEILEVARAATEAMPELPLPGLDIALTETGPVVLESNAYCFAIAPQLQFGGLRPTLESLLPRLAVDPERRDDALWALRTGEPGARRNTH